MKVKTRSSVRWLSLATAAMVAHLLCTCAEVAGLDQKHRRMADCIDCATSLCAAERASCLADAACVERVACLDACASSVVDCPMRCAAEQRVPSYYLAARYQQCRALHCADWCGSPCASVPVAAVPDTVPECATCIMQRCCQEAASCTRATDCYAVLECARAYPAPDWALSCGTTRHKGTEERDWSVTDLNDCIEKDCREACGLGRDWSCLTSTRTPTISRDVEFAVKVAEFPSNGAIPIEGATVRICHPIDHACSQPVASAVSDRAGLARFDLAVPIYVGQDPDSNADGLRGHIEVTDESGKHLTTLQPLQPPHTQSGVTRLMEMPTPEFVGIAAASMKLVAEEGTGVVIVSVRDCANKQAPGVVLNFTPDAHPFYMNDRTIFPDPESTQTDYSGQVIIVNVQPPSLDVQAFFAGTSTLIGRTQQVPVRAGAITHAFVQPPP